MSGTPETDAAQHEGLLRTNPIPMQVVTANFARKLERERDAARADLEFRRGLYKVQEEHLENARKELREWQTLCLWGGTPEHIHDFIKGQQTRIHEAQDIEKTCEQLERERDEAREALKHIEEYGTEEINAAVKLRQKLASALVERDEARSIAAELAVIASHCLGSHSFSLNQTSERIADTLKRWRKMKGEQ